MSNRGIDIVSKNSEMNTSMRIALVIGNSEYECAPLKNCVNDAQDIAKALKTVNFDVTIQLNVTRSQIRKEVRAFGDKLKLGGVGLFYYAGHGMQIKGRNFLIPVGTDIKAEDEVEDEAVDMGAILRKMESAGNPMNIVILDACRNNPFARSFRSVSQGLAQMDAPSGSLIIYATAPGSIAADGKERNGVFTKYLLEHIKSPNIEIAQLMRRIRVNVKEETYGEQIPWESSSLEGDFYFIKKDFEEEKRKQEESKRLVKEEAEKLAEEKKKLEEEAQRIREESKRLEQQRFKMQREQKLQYKNILAKAEMLQKNSLEDALHYLEKSKTLVNNTSHLKALEKEIKEKQERACIVYQQAYASYQRLHIYDSQEKLKQCLEISPGFLEAKNLQKKVTLRVKEYLKVVNEGLENYQNQQYEKALLSWEHAANVLTDDNANNERIQQTKALVQKVQKKAIKSETPSSSENVLEDQEREDETPPNVEDEISNEDGTSPNVENMLGDQEREDKTFPNAEDEPCSESEDYKISLNTKDTLENQNRTKRAKRLKKRETKNKKRLPKIIVLVLLTIGVLSVCAWSTIYRGKMKKVFAKIDTKRDVDLKKFLKDFSTNDPFSNIDDKLRKKANAFLQKITRKETEKIKEKWVRYIKNMKIFLTRTESIEEKDTISIKKKIAAWNEFLKRYQNDNPFSLTFPIWSASQIFQCKQDVE